MEPTETVLPSATAVEESASEIVAVSILPPLGPEILVAPAVTIVPLQAPTSVRTDAPAAITLPPLITSAAAETVTAPQQIVVQMMEEAEGNAQTSYVQESSNKFEVKQVQCY